MKARVDYVVVGLGGLGSAAAWELARRGHHVLGLDRFRLGHAHGASHDTSRILRHSYHTPAYVRLTQEAYADWATLERESGERLVTRTGGLDVFPPDPAIPSVDTVAKSIRRRASTEYARRPAVASHPQREVDRVRLARRRDQAAVQGRAGQHRRARVQPAAASTRSMFCNTARSCDSMSSPTMAPVCGSTGARPGMITRPPMRAPAGSELRSASR